MYDIIFESILTLQQVAKTQFCSFAARFLQASWRRCCSSSGL